MDETMNNPNKSKRGRKKKWDNSNFKNYSTNKCESLNFVEKKPCTSVEKEPEIDSTFDDLNFGNLTIKIKAKEPQNYSLSF